MVTLPFSQRNNDMDNIAALLWVIIVIMLCALIPGIGWAIGFSILAFILIRFWYITIPLAFCVYYYLQHMV